MDTQAMLDRIKVFKCLKKDNEIAPLLGLSAQNFSNRKKRGSLMPIVAEWASKEGINAAWIIYGEGEMRPGEVNGHSTPMIEETAAAYRKGLELDGEPLTQREINELTMLRWLEEKHPERRQRISDQLTEVFIAAKAKG